jgi:hypothetical protein
LAKMRRHYPGACSTACLLVKSDADDSGLH